MPLQCKPCRFCPIKQKAINRDHTTLFSTFEDQLNPKHLICQLVRKIDWQRFEDAFTPLYSSKPSLPAKPIRRMVGLLILKHLKNISDESVVEQWSENAYYQYFCRESSFVPEQPCNSSELVHFRHRIGEAGIELILQESIRVNKNDDHRRSNKVSVVYNSVGVIIGAKSFRNEYDGDTVK